MVGSNATLPYYGLEMYNNPSGGAWAPGMAMPPLGFGVVAQQPTGNRMMAAGQQIPPQAQPVAAWQQQQYIAAQMGMASAAAVGVQPMPQQQQQGFHQYQQPQQLYPQQHYQQQQWIEAQKKVAEEQKKFYDQMMKQRQFDEQKMRLKAFSNSRKGGVSADSMIENILGPKDSQKPKSPPAPKKAPVSEGSKVAESSLAKQGTAVDWSKMNNIETLFTSTKEGLSLQPASHTPVVSAASENVAGDHGVDPSCLGVKLAFSSSGVASGHVGNTPPQQVKSSDHAVVVPNGPSGTGGNPMPCQKPHGKSIPLPSWLSDKASIPAVYRHACSLVEGKDGWVDTSRAYMLLMKTGLPPPFLGILWEMVNRTQPGQLLDQEFTTLLALVALVQSGQAITSPDVLSLTAEPVLPVIDHPALLPLVQDYIQHRQQIQQQQQQQHQQPQPQQPLPQLPGSSEKENLQEVNKEDDDEFEDFVSGPTPINGPGDFNSLAGSVNNQVNVISSQSLAATTALTTPQLGNKPIPPPIEKMKKMNLPEVGFSPELSPSTSFDHALDDDFDDFQSAAMTNVSGSSSSVAPQTNQVLSSTSTEASSSCNALSQDSFSNLNNCQDRYAVFRELELGGEDSAAGNTNSLPHDMGSNDDSFGDFCSSEPASLTLASSTFPPLMTNTAGSGTSNTTPVSFEVFSTPPEVPESSVDAQFEADFGVFNSAPSQQPCNYADIHEAMKRVEEDQKQKAQDNWADPFGEFEEAGRSIASTTQPIPQLNMDSAADDDFGDFMGPDGGLAEPDSLSFGQHFPKLSETLGETQSVASLELPGLEMTVGLQASESRGSGSGQSPDLFLQPRSEIGGVEEQLRGLTLDSSLVTSDTSSLNGGGISPNGNGSGGITQSTGSPAVLDSFTGGLMDKYSIIREEASKNSHDEAHTGSWQRCLEGSVKLLEHGHGILTKLMDKKLKSEVLATSQMQDYLFNLQEVWYVCDRISKSSQRVTTSIKVDQLLAQAKSLWEEILLDSESSLSKQVEMPGSENQMNEGEVCGVCLAGGGSKLTYGGHSYHPPCANLWLNCVDLLLPSLTPVTLL
ncbi:synergin gamma-like isoform X1 [Macrobrachium nipponense]|uniref:synergin gamma-like isoform X1 n=2 Tax=Macrobrachium nipponense TaxID=159736 RepID=UPI0030C82805